MRRLFRPRILGLPVVLVVVLLVAVLTAGSALAIGGFQFKTFTTVVDVGEPLTVEYNLDGQYGGDSLWHPLGDTDSLTLERSAGDDFDMRLKITNIADNALTVNTVITGVGIEYFTPFGFPSDTVPDNVLKGVTVFPVSFDVAGNTPTGEYTITFSFDRS